MTAVHLPNDRAIIPRVGEIVGRLEDDGYDGIWIGEVNNLDAVVPAALAAAAATVDVGVLLNVFTRAPTTLAMTAATLADLAPGRMHVVLGVASPMLVERWNGIPYRQPFARLRDSLRFVRRALAGERMNGFALPQLPAEPPRVLIAACGPKAVALGVDEADGVVLNWLGPDDVASVVTSTGQASVSVVVPVCPTADRSVFEAVMRPIVGDYLNAPAYADQQRRLGRGPALQPVWDAWDRGDRAGAHAALSDAVLDELVVWGTPADCRARLAAFEATTGARAIATYFPPPGGDYLECATRR